MITYLNSTCLTVHFGIHYNKFRTQFADTTAFKDRHQASQVLQIEGVAWASCLWILFGTLHCTMQSLVSHCRVANKVANVVWIRNRRL